MRFVARLLPVALVFGLLMGVQGTITAPSADAQIPLAPTIQKSFAPASITTAQTSVLSITVTNPNAFTLTTVAYTDQIPAGLTAAPFAAVANASCVGASVTTVANLVTVSYTSIAANTSCVVRGNITSATPGVYVNNTSTVTSTIPGAVVPPGGPANATLVVTAPPVATATPVPPTATPIVVVPPAVIPQVFQHVPTGIFNGTRNNTPTPVRPAVAAVVVDPAVMPVLRPPSTGEAGLADNGPTTIAYGFGLIAMFGVITFAAARVKAVRNR
jgi:uncharacterized repeat protein (TIGR01451 family)